MSAGGPFPADKERPRRDADHSPHLVPRSRISRSYTFSYPWCLYGVAGQLYFFIRNLYEDGDKWRALVNTVMSIEVLYTLVVLTSCATIQLLKVSAVCSEVVRLTRLLYRKRNAIDLQAYPSRRTDRRHSYWLILYIWCWVAVSMVIIENKLTVSYHRYNGIFPCPLLLLSSAVGGLYQNKSNLLIRAHL
jgi:hypothetical protein